MKEKDFEDLRPYDNVFVTEENQLMMIEVVDVRRNMVLIKGNTYELKDIETEDFYVVEVLGKEVLLHAELVLVNDQIDELLSESDVTKNISKLKKLSNIKNKICQELEKI